MLLSKAVMAHPRRTVSARRIAHGMGPDAEVCLDPQPDGPPRPLRTAVRAWRHCPAGSTHHLVVQDDVLLAADFITHVTDTVTARPDAVIALYANSTSWNGALARVALLAGYGWASPSPVDYFPTLALVMPCPVAHEFAGYAARALRHEQDDDEVLARFLRQTGHEALLRVPNLVEHDDQPSLVGYDTQGVRRSVAFLRPGFTEPVERGRVPRVLALAAFRQRRSFLRIGLPRCSGRPSAPLLWAPGHHGRLALLHLSESSVRTAADTTLCELREFGALPERKTAVRRFLRELLIAGHGLGWAVAHVPAGTAAPAAFQNPSARSVLRGYVEAGLGFHADVLRWERHMPGLIDYLAAAVTQAYHRHAASASVSALAHEGQR